MTLALRTDGTLGRWLAGREGGLGGALERAGVQAAAVISSDPVGMRELFANVPTSSGYAVTDQTSMLVSTVVACLTRLGGAVLQLPVHHYRLKEGDAGREQVTPHSPLWWMLNEEPVPNWTAASWREWIVRCVHLRGDQHTEILRAPGASQGGRAVGLLPHHPDCSTARLYRSGDETRIAYDFYNPVTGKFYTRDQDDVLHFTGFGFDGLKSLSVIRWAARNAIGNSLAASDYAGKSIGAGALPKIALTYPNKLDKGQKELLRESFVATYGGGPTQTHLPLVLTEGGKAEKLTISPVDMQLLESRQLDADQICEAFGVPPILIGRSEKSSSWGTGIEQITLGFVKFTLRPHLVRWQQELNRKLFRRAGQFVEFDLDALLAGDSKAQADSFRLAIGGPGSGDGWMSVDEVRGLKNLPALGGDYAKPFRAQRGTTKSTTTTTETSNQGATP